MKSTEVSSQEEMRALREMNEQLRQELAESKRQGDALRRSGTVYRALFDSANDAITINDSEGKIIRVNRTAVERFGYSEEEFLTMSGYSLEAPEECPRIAGRIEHTRLHGQNVFQTTYQRCDGTAMPVEVSSRVIDYEGSRAILNIVRDITDRKVAEEKLRESQIQFRSLFAHMSEGVCLHRLVRDEKGMVVDYEIFDMNEQYEKILDVKRENMVHRLATEVYGMSEAPYLTEFANVVQTGLPQHFETFFAPMNKHFVISVAAMGTDGFATIFFDITDLKTAEGRIRENEERIALAARVASIGVWDWDIKSRLLFWDEKMFDIYGITKEVPMPLERWSALVIPEDRAAVSVSVQEAIAEKGHGYAEFRIIRPDGAIRYVQMAHGASVDEDGQVRHVIGINADITERRLAEQALRKNEATLRSILKTTPIGIALGTLDRVIVWVNDTMCLYAGRKREELEGQPARILYPDDEEFSRVAVVVYGAVRQGKQGSVEAKWIRGDGGIRDMQISASPLDPMDPSAGVVFTAMDITGGRGVGDVMRPCRALLEELPEERARERKETQEEIRRLRDELEAQTVRLVAANKESASLSYAVSHDLRAPLRSIDGYSRLILEDYAARLDEDGRGFLNSLCNAAGRMTQLIDNLLAYSRLERRTFMAETVVIRALIDRVLTGFTDEIHAGKVTLTVSAPEATVHVDTPGLDMVLRNLIDNALKFTKTVARPVIDIGGEKGATSCVLWVKDNGIGFDMKDHEGIFEIFQRLHREEDYPGAGAGLALAKKAVERMGGRIWAESKPGEGATFFLEVPL